MNKQQLALRLIMTALVAAAGSPAFAMWKWRDANGVVQFTDRPPPASIPDKNIIQRPSQARSVVVESSATAASAASATGAASAPALKGTDPALDAKKREKEQADLLKKKNEEEKLAKQRKENCANAKAYQKSLNDGIRIVRPNAKGENEILDDAARAKEANRAKQVIASDCS